MSIMVYNVSAKEYRRNGKKQSHKWASGGSMVGWREADLHSQMAKRLKQSQSYEFKLDRVLLALLVDY